MSTPFNTAFLDRMVHLASKKLTVSTLEAVELLKLVKAMATYMLIESGCPQVSVKAINTKFNDAGRRSAPWKPTSSRVAGRPQDGADGNRINRWLMDPTHKFYATETDATLLQIRYYLQMLSMAGAPAMPRKDLTECFEWLAGHKIIPGLYEDPIQLIPIPLQDFINNPRGVTSGHLIPLDRGGKHIPSNAYLMLHRSNALQGNLTLDELIELLRRIVKLHDERGVKGRHVG